VLAESLNENNSLDLEQLRAWAKEHFAPYKILRRLQVLDDLPRHAVPKVK
jgi:acyl-coenzyme A synthetase/AMP-(fatty) acid ligase